MSGTSLLDGQSIDPLFIQRVELRQIELYDLQLCRENDEEKSIKEERKVLAFREERMKERRAAIEKKLENMEEKWRSQ